MFDTHAHYSLGSASTSVNYPALDVCVDPFYFSSLYPYLIHSAGFHPLYLPAESQFDSAMEHLDTLIASKMIQVVGEIGFDTRVKNLGLQIQYFEAQWQLAYSHDVPISIHLVKSTQSFKRALNDLPCHDFVVHGFSGHIDLACWIVSKGGNIGIGSQLLNSSNRKIQGIVRDIPIESMLIETDWPFVNSRLKDELSAQGILERIILTIAGIKSLNPEEVDKILTQNSINFFRLNDV